jgi:hypothetical protein
MFYVCSITSTCLFFGFLALIFVLDDLMLRRAEKTACFWDHP